ncbi:cytochrome P450 [Microtetraspora sp. NBRC 13810]|uniref:cytochrome P450 family protein n=1 Tax=Microtetraspora sp. NBRC 13810 TaxID=3030990 RepID=UPI00249FE204|nr:cytochrome P450 [Microtetraspora sp. NBRC 13810]GLW08031.1 cytochrome P450 [Microtetraspora sp. NBRC 13810]
MATPPPVPIDPFGSDLVAEAARLRALGTAVMVEMPGGIPAWAITRHQALRALLLDSAVSKDPRLHWRLWPQAAGRPEWQWILGWIGVRNMLSAYGADHRRLRKLIAPTFTARRTKTLQPIIERITLELLDDLSARPAGAPVDLRAAYAQPLPMRVICELFGVPDEMRPEIARVMDAFMDTTSAPEQAAATFSQITALLSDIIEHKRAHPADDLTTDLINIRDEDGAGDRLDGDELRDTLLLVIGAGHETTVNLIGNAVHALLTHPGQLEQVLGGSVSWEAVIEETLRWAPSIANLPLRFAVRDLEVDGVTIPAGDAILTTFLAAGHDPAQHGPDAGRFDATRDPGEHLAFGVGVHHCVGAPLARQEAFTALPALFARFPGLRLAEDPAGVRQVPSFIALGWHRLPVLLTP